MATILPCPGLSPFFSSGFRAAWPSAGQANPLHRAERSANPQICPHTTCGMPRGVHEGWRSHPATAVWALAAARSQAGSRLASVVCGRCRPQMRASGARKRVPHQPIKWGGSRAQEAGPTALLPSRSEAQTRPSALAFVRRARLGGQSDATAAPHAPKTRPSGSPYRGASSGAKTPASTARVQRHDVAPRLPRHRPRFSRFWRVAKCPRKVS